MNVLVADVAPLNGIMGQGLGLSIVRAIADAHDGSAWVESSEGYGATFGLDLPAGRPYDGDDQGTVS